MLTRLIHHEHELVDLTPAWRELMMSAARPQIVLDPTWVLPWWRIFDTEGNVMRELDDDPFARVTGAGAQDDASPGCDEPSDDVRALVTEVEATL